MVLAGLAIVWFVVIGSYVRERTASRTGDTVTAFQDQLTTLRRTQPGARVDSAMHGAPAQRSTTSAWHSAAARRRRRDVLFGLVGAAVFTLFVALVTGSMLVIAVNILFDLAAVAYVALLVNQQRIMTEQRAKVRPIRTAPVARQAPYRGRQVAAGGVARMR